MFSLPFVLWTIQMHPVSRALISFPCCPQCDKNIKYLDINLTFQDSYKYVIICYRYIFPISFARFKGQKFHWFYTIYLNQKCKGVFNIWSAIFTNLIFYCLQNWLEKTYQEFYSSFHIFILPWNLYALKPKNIQNNAKLFWVGYLLKNAERSLVREVR